MTGSPELFNSQTCPCWGSNNWLIVILVFLTLHWLPLTLQLINHCSVKQWFSVCIACLSSLGGSALPWVLPSKDPRRVVDFWLCLDFSMLLGWSGDFEAPYMGNWRPEVFLIFSIKILNRIGSGTEYYGCPSKDFSLLVRQIVLINLLATRLFNHLLINIITMSILLHM